LGLDRSAALIVRLLNESQDQGDAASELSRRFGIPPDQALADVGAVVAAVKGLSATRMGKLRRPTVAGVRVVAQSWRRQSWRYRLATAQVTAIVVAIEVGLKITDVRHLAEWLRVPLATGESRTPASGPADLTGLSEREQRLHWAISWVMANWLYDGTCLRRALAFGWFVRARHPVLRLGMLSDEKTIAHAWIEFEGKVFNDQPGIRAFASGVTDQKSGALMPFEQVL